MTVKGLIEFLEQALVSGRAKPTDLVIIAEYDRVHLRPAPDGYLPNAIVMTREERPTRESVAVDLDRCVDCRSDQHDTTAERDNTGKRRRCRACNKYVDGNRVYFGVVGPFCCVPCRNRWNEASERS
jgi:hypothetical protein